MDNQYDSSSANSEILKCIWMSSGIIEYKLCDKNFDCENCPVDIEFGNFSSDGKHPSVRVPDIINIILNKLESIKYDTQIIYLKNHLIARQIQPNTYYLGVSPVLICCLDNVGVMMECGAGKNILSGQPVMNFFGEWGTVSLSAPFNFSIYDKVNNPADDPMKSKWFAIIGAIRQEITSGSLGHSEWEVSRTKSIKIIEDIKISCRKVGLTMQDGGSPAQYLHHVIGNDKYLEMLKLLIS
jgi:hypothetical protein